uniref:G-protein coupled receptors family 1 profile domain-containing protein n=1 Tax=Athene cunicularia TaxID=194338 RepID=A0A663MT71_ATHCN
MGSRSNHSYFRNDTGSSEDQSFSLFDVHILVPVTIISIVLFFMGVSGNLITIVIFRRSQEMRTTVNMYLSSMALSDTLIFLGLPSDLYRLWKYKPYIFGDFLCKFFIYLSETCTYCTILHITTVSVERYFAICFPLKAKATVTKYRVKRVILALWGCSLLTAGPILFLFGVEHPHGSVPQESRECRSIERVARTGLLEAMTWVSTVYFFLPMLCLTLLYGLICRRLRRSGQRLPGCRATGRRRAHTQTVKMLGKGGFETATTPCQEGAERGDESLEPSTVTLYVQPFCLSLASLDCCLDPILYFFMTSEFQDQISRHSSLVIRSRLMSKESGSSIKE